MRRAEATHPMVVVGGGIAGLATALGLARIGADALILEQSPAFSEIGAGLQVGPNAARALRWLGALDAIEPYLFAPPAIRIFDGPTGRELMVIRLGARFAQRFGEPYQVVHRADLLMGLLSATGSEPSIRVETSAQVAEIGVEHGSLAVATDDGRKLSTSGVIGADGIRSTVRRSLPRSQEPRYRGYAIYRALIPVAGMPEELLDDCVCLWLCPGGHVVHYPVRSGRAMNIVAVTASAWNSERWSEPALRDELEPLFARSCDALRALTQHPLIWTKWAGADLEPSPVWSRGRLTLIGDAAHATLPFLAQGAAMSLEDAVVLARTLRRNGISDGFELYVRLRYERTRRLTLASRKAGWQYHLDGLPRKARNGILSATSPDRFLNRLSWIYSYDPLAD
ncbi:MAG: FAD-dependent monooxygenase [Rhizobiales bacterium]|nr:FAD-dependent monooxygenase [Hyphomicrobiales bacterium]